MKTSNRFTVCLAAFLAAAVLFSALFVVLEADHECDDENCSVCAQISVCADLFRQTGVCLTALALALLFHRLTLAGNTREGSAPVRSTPVALKVKLSN